MFSVGQAGEAQYTLHGCGLFLGKNETPWVKSCIRHWHSQWEKRPAEVSITARRQSTRLFRNMQHVFQHIPNISLWEGLADLWEKQQNPLIFTSAVVKECSGISNMGKTQKLCFKFFLTTLNVHPNAVLGATKFDEEAQAAHYRMWTASVTKFNYKIST